MSIIERLRTAFAGVKAVIQQTAAIAIKYGPELRLFVIETAEELSILIPDHGYGNVKLMAFDMALKIFLDQLKATGADDKEIKGVWDLAHVLLEGHVAAKKARAGTL